MENKVLGQNDLISFIIPAKNEENEIGKTLKAIIDGSLKAPFEMIVVDNGSADKTENVARSMGAKVYRKLNGTIGSLRNFGVSKSKGSLIVFLDADITLDDSWFDEISSVLEDINKRPNLITGSHCVVPGDGGWLDKYWFGNFDQSTDTTHLGSGHLILSRNFWNSCKGFDESLETGEDYEFCSRAKSIGGVVENNPKLKVIHRDYPKTICGFVKRESWHGIGDSTSFHKIIKSKVALSSALFIVFHLMIISPLLIHSSLLISILGGILLLSLLVFSSIYKFGHSGLISVIVNIYIFYFYYLGRSISFLRAALRK